MTTKKRRVVNYLRRGVRRRKVAAILDERIKEETVCPKCGWFFSLSFLARASAFSEEEKKMGGKQVVCPNCKTPLWYNSDGKVEAVVVRIVPETQTRVHVVTKARCIFYAFIARIIRKIRGLPPPDST